jgi:hypothetical protein
VKVPVAPPNQPYSVEVIRGSKRDQAKILDNEH